MHGHSPWATEHPDAAYTVKRKIKWLSLPARIETLFPLLVNLGSAFIVLCVSTWFRAFQTTASITLK
jgi:hypothetical protein